MRLIESALGIADFVVRDAAIKDAFAQYFKSGRPAKETAAVSFLAVTGRYPSLAELDPVTRLLTWGRPGEALDFLLRQRKRGHQHIHLEVSKEIEWGVSQLAKSSAHSGIPRLTRELAGDAHRADEGLAVWSAGYLGRAAFDDEKKRVVLSSRYWRIGPGALIGSLLESWFRHHAFQALGLSVALSRFFQLGIPLARMIWRQLGDSARPRKVLLLKEVTWFQAEVPKAEESDRLALWSEVVESVSIDVLIHDWLPITHPHFFGSEQGADHIGLLGLAEKSRRVVVGSDWLKNQTQNILKALGKATPSIVVAEFPDLLTRGQAQLDEPLEGTPYILFIGGFESRKGLSDLLPKISHFLESNRMKLVVVGTPNPLRRGELDLYRYAKSLRKWVTCLTSVNDDKLDQLYLGARFCIYVSEAEGFGLPLVEAANRKKLIVTRPIEPFMSLSKQMAAVRPVWKQGMSEFEVAETLAELDLAVAAAPQSTTSIESWKESIHPSNVLFDRSEGDSPQIIAQRRESMSKRANGR